MSNKQNAGCAFDVVSDGNPFNTNLVNAPFLPGNLPVAVRYAGGCSGIDAETVAKMPAYFEPHIAVWARSLRSPAAR